MILAKQLASKLSLYTNVSIMSKILYLILFVLCFVDVISSANGEQQKVFTFNRQQLDETSRPLKIDKKSNSTILPDLLIIVNSAAANSEKRKAVRETWGKVAKHDPRVVVYFLVGSTEDLDLQSQIETEDAQNGDLLQAHVLDSYHNVTLKTLVMLRFMAHYCPNKELKWALKVDDDMLLNVRRVINFVRETNCSQALYGRLASGWSPIRHPKNKNYCPKDCFPEEIFPDFLTGGTILLDAKLAAPMYEYAMTHNSTASVIEDMFITGIVAQALNISRIGFYGLDYEWNTAHPTNACLFEKHFSTEQSPPTKYRLLWKLVNSEKCNTVPPLSELTGCTAAVKQKSQLATKINYFSIFILIGLIDLLFILFILHRYKVVCFA